MPQLYWTELPYGGEEERSAATLMHDFMQDRRQKAIVCPTQALHQRLSEAQSPSVLGGRVRYLVLPEFHL